MADKFAGKSAVITGGSTGIGLATAKRFVQEGMDHVFITGRRKDALNRAVAEIGKGLTAVHGDVASLSDLDRLYGEVGKRNRKIDVIFANAGIAQLGPFGSVDEKFYDLHFDANVKGIFFTVQKALPLINDGGSVILTGSIADVKGFPAISVYSATKAAIRSFARTWTNETERPPHPRQHHQPGTYRYANFRHLAARRRVDEDERRSCEECPSGQAGRSG
jgi:NAD(P)-dependent dehydrogenase (short-subunit alcohol dehydrogenase family)